MRSRLVGAVLAAAPIVSVALVVVIESGKRWLS
jgi:hypothetical protein